MNRDEDQDGVDVSAFRLTLREGEFDAVGALFRKGANQEAPAGFNFLDTRSGLQGTKVPSPGPDQFCTARHFFVAAIDSMDVIRHAREALATAKQAGALCLLVIPVDESGPPVLGGAMPAQISAPEADCVIYVPGEDAVSALLAVMTRSCAGIADQYAIAVDYNDLRTVLSSGRTGVMVSAHGPTPAEAHAVIVEQTSKALSRIAGLTPSAIKGDVLCIGINNRDHRPAISVIGPHLKMMSGSAIPVLYNPGYWPTVPWEGADGNFVSRIVNW